MNFYNINHNAKTIGLEIQKALWLLRNYLLQLTNFWQVFLSTLLRKHSINEKAMGRYKALNKERAIENSKTNLVNLQIRN